MVVDELVLSLGLDPTKFSQGAQEQLRQLRGFEDQAVQTGKAIENQQQRLFGLISTIRREALGGLALFFGGRGLVEMIQHVTSLDASTFRLAKTMDMSAGEVSVWQGAIKQAGGTAEGANSALAGLSAEMSRFQLTGESQMLPVLSRLGISLYDQNRNLKSSGQLWLELADAVRGMDPREAAAFLQMIPGANQEMINFALLGRRAMEQYLESARQAGVTTAESAQQALEYQRALGLVDTAATNLGRTLLTALGPALTGTMNAFGNVLKMLSGAPGAREAEARTELLDARGEIHLENWLRSWVGMAPVESTERSRAALRAVFAAHRRANRAAAGAPGMGENWENFLSGLSFLETSQTGAPSQTSSARGFFQFTRDTAADAVGAGIPDPRFGTYAAQADATMQFIRRFHPDAAAAIERGDFASAIASLRGRWPSLPGGSQPQTAARYQTFASELLGGGPRPPVAPPLRPPAPASGGAPLLPGARPQVGPPSFASEFQGGGAPKAMPEGGGTTNNVDVGGVTVVVPPGSDGATIGDAALRTIQRGLDAGSANNALR